MDHPIYERPVGGKIIADIMAKHPGRSHPRILFTHDTMGKFQLNIQNNEFMAKRWQIVRAMADEALTAEPYKYHRVNHRLTVHEKIQERLLVLSIAYQVTGDPAYAERLWKEIYNCCVVFPNWNSYHMLETGIITLGLAVAYDWLFDYWNDEQKRIIETAILERGIKIVMEDYLDLPRERASGTGKGWVGYNNNWSFLVTGCVMAGTMAICDSRPEYLERCAVMLGMGIRQLEGVLASYAPDGGFIEGPHYWRVANTYLAYLGANLLSAAGTDYGILKTPGLQKTAFFNFDMLGPAGSFNFSDSWKGYHVCSECLWFAGYYKEPALVALYRYATEEMGLRIEKATCPIKELLFYPVELENAPYTPPLDSYYRRVETITMRDSWDMKNGYFIGFRAGENGVSHYHMDCGGFVFDMNGKRFALDLGIGTYNEEGLYWRYRYSAQGHNTWVINPGPEYTQNPKAKTTVIRHEFGEAEGYAIADLTDAYVTEVEKLHRGIYAKEGRRVFVVQDELKAKKPSEAYWQMHTEAQIEILPGGKQAVLALEDDRVLVTLLTDNNAVFEVHKAWPYEGTPYYPVSDNDDKTPKLILHFTGLTQETVAVEFRHFMADEAIPVADTAVMPMEQWGLKERE